MMRRTVRRSPRTSRPPHSIAQILRWADDFHERTGRWPNHLSGPIAGSLGETWSAIRTALRDGRRGLPGGSSLARLLAERRGVRNIQDLPPLSEELIVAWADDHHQRTGQWPRRGSGKVRATPAENWSAVDQSLTKGVRGLPGGSSLTQLLAEQRGVRNCARLPPLSIRQILIWADAYYERTGHWPKSRSGPIEGAPGETWQAVDMALFRGVRGLPGGSSLARLLAKHRSVRNLQALPRLTLKQILIWADAHHRRTGNWPTKESGRLDKLPGETWFNIDQSLRTGLRGLRVKSTLALLLAKQRGVPNRRAKPILTIDRILAWADAHFRRTGQWPQIQSGVVREAPSMKWMGIDAALRLGGRGLPGGSTLLQLLKHHRKIADPRRRPRKR